MKNLLLIIITAICVSVFASCGDDGKDVPIEITPSDEGIVGEWECYDLYYVFSDGVMRAEELVEKYSTPVEGETEEEIAARARNKQGVLDGMELYIDNWIATINEAGNGLAEYRKHIGEKDWQDLIHWQKNDDLTYEFSFGKGQNYREGTFTYVTDADSFVTLERLGYKQKLMLRRIEKE